MISLLAGINFISSAVYSAPCGGGGIHGVQIAEYCFDCSVESDGICPIDFGVAPENCIVDPDCIQLDAFWSLNGNAPISDDIFYLAENPKKNYSMVVPNTGLTSGTVNFYVFKSDTFLKKVNATVGAGGKVIGIFEANSTTFLAAATKYTISFEAEISGENKTSNDLKINATLEDFPSPTLTCAGYTNATSCNADADNAAPSNRSFTLTTSGGEVCRYTNRSNCTWSDSLNCTTVKWTYANASNNDSCTSVYNIGPGESTTACSYIEGAKQGNCELGDAFFKVVYNPTIPSSGCASWTSEAIPCPRKLQLPFFGVFGFLASILIISGIYLIINKKRRIVI